MTPTTLKCFSLYGEAKVMDTKEGRWRTEKEIQIATLPSVIILYTLPVLVSHGSAERCCALATSWTGLPESALRVQ